MKVITEVKIRFCETDMAGHVNNTSYFVYLEDARGAFFDKALPGRKRGSYVAASVKCDYVRQAFFGRPLMIETELVKIGNKSLELKHTMLDKETGDCVAKGQSIEVHFNPEKQVGEPIPDEMRKQLELFLEPVKR